MAPTEQELPRIGDFVAAKYRIEEMLGRGGMGAVFRVTHAVTGKHFAVKWLLPQYHAGQEVAQRFIREAQVAGRVDHPNVVEVYDIGEDGGSMYMVMELLQGESLAQHLARLGRLPASQACQLLIPVARGLAAAHRSGIIHRDLKPDNIFLSVSTIGEPRPKILDFGISKMSALATDANPALTREGVVMGTPHYMAPEQLRSNGVDQRCDIYALGVILYQLIGGKLPFVGDNFPDLMLKIVSETPLSLAKLAPETPRDLVAIIECAMSRSPAERFDTVADFGRALEPYADGALFDVEQALSARPPSSIFPSPATPVATESRFPGSRYPDSMAQSLGFLQRAQRVAVPLAVSAASALLFSWLFVSIDNQNAAPPEAARSLAGTAVARAESSETSQLALRAQPEATATLDPAGAGSSDLDALPVPDVQTIAELAAPAQTLPDTPSLIGSSAQFESPEPIAEVEPVAVAEAEPAAPQAVAPPPAPAATEQAPSELPAGITAPAAPQRIAFPTPVPPPGAAQAEGELAKAKPQPAKKKDPAKKAPAKSFVSPEIRINDFFQ